jgi:N-acyl-D-amino-acid deacylase
MPYDLLLKNGRVIDGSGMPEFRADVGVADGKIVDVGRLDGTAKRVLDLQGQAVAPGFIDNHCHFDAQALWDPLCTFACYHGTTTVINGNCSLGLAPARPDERYALTSMLSRVEAIPLRALEAGVEWEWETIPEYLDALDRRLGMNVGTLIGYSAVRRYVMGEAAYTEQATPEQIEAMKAIIREGVRAGALGLSFERQPNHMDLELRLLPCNIASSDELVAAASALADVGAGTIQFGDFTRAEMTEGLLTRIAAASGRPMISNFAGQNGYEGGARIYPTISPFMQSPSRWTLLTVATFDGLPAWLPVMNAEPDEKRRLIQNPEVRARLRADANRLRTDGRPGVDWDSFYVGSVGLEKNQRFVERSVEDIARELDKDPVDTFFDLVLEEDLKTSFYPHSKVGVEEKAAALRRPGVIPGLSDGGAHVIRRCQSHYTTFMLSYWVRETGMFSLEEAVRKLTFLPASIFGLHDRGLIRPGLAADLVVFDPDTIEAGEMDEVADFPAGAVRKRRLSQGIEYTIVNGEVLIEEGEHTGSYPGRVARGGRGQGDHR